jgi:hypothetical protein
VVQHGDVLGHPDRVRRGQHDPQLADADALGLHREVKVEQHRVVGQLETLDVEMVLGEADRVVAKLVGQADLFGQLAQHPLVEVGAHTGHALLDLGAAANAGQVEDRGFHSCPPLTLAGVAGGGSRGCSRSAPR